MTASLNDLDERFRPYAAWIVAVAQAYFGGGTVTSTRRSWLKQAELYVTKTSQVNRPGHSPHELGLALDFVVAAGSSSPDQRTLGAIWNYYLWDTWRAADPVHFSPYLGSV